MIFPVQSQQTLARGLLLKIKFYWNIITPSYLPKSVSVCATIARMDNWRPKPHAMCLPTTVSWQPGSPFITEQLTSLVTRSAPERWILVTFDSWYYISPSTLLLLQITLKTLVSLSSQGVGGDLSWGSRITVFLPPSVQSWLVFCLPRVLSPSIPWLATYTLISSSVCF